MQIKINPRIDGRFVKNVLDAPRVLDRLEEIDLSEEQFSHVHDLAKSIIITAVNTLDIDVNKIINELKE